ncbi:MAG: hypothetical protein ACI381_08185, partial [Candidatus Methanomethylophilaceae archaeon]
ILGLTAGSVITVSVQAIMKLNGTEMIAMSIAGIVIGLLLGIGLSKVASSYAKETISEKV